MILYASKIFMKQCGILHQTVNSSHWKESNETINKDDDDGYYYEDDYYSGGGGGDDVALIESCLT